MFMHLPGKAVLVIVLSISTVLAAVKKGPYLIYEGNPTAMTVLWQMDSSKNCTIKWGLDKTYKSGIARTVEYNNSTHQHRYAISNLAPVTRYYYKITGVWSGSFVTAPDSEATNVKLFAYGDTRSHPTDNNKVCGQMVKSKHEISQCCYCALGLSSY
jgi:phosphodiesterase/alkaline phosphatase D-like protein